MIVVQNPLKNRPVPSGIPILSVKHGGQAVEIRKTNGVDNEVPLRTYCRFYYQRPIKISHNYLCAGHVCSLSNAVFFPRCADYYRCLRNQTKTGKAKEPYDRPPVLPDT